MAIDLVAQSAPLLLRGAAVTVGLAVVSFAAGLMIGLVVALARISTLRPARAAAGLYVSFIRGTPLLVQLFAIYYGLAEFGLRFDPITSAIVGLSLNVGGYTAEVFRGAILSVPLAQTDGARALGLSRWQAMRLVVLPQAARAALPPLGNTAIGLVKDTSLAATIQVPELFREAQLITARTFQIFAMYATVALLYWALSGLLAWGQARLEARATRFRG